MAARRIDVATLSKRLREDVAVGLHELKADRVPWLAVILVGDNSANQHPPPGG